jgi:hypothetical protein
MEKDSELMLASDNTFLLLVWPLRIFIFACFMLRVLESNLIRQAFALPFSGAAVRWAVQVISCLSFIFIWESLLLDAVVMTLIKMMVVLVTVLINQMVCLELCN